MNTIQRNEICPLLKKDRRCRTLPYHHFKTIKKKFAGLKKGQGHLAGCPGKV